MMVKEVKSLKDLNLVDRFLFDESMEEHEVYQAVVRKRSSSEKIHRIHKKIQGIRMSEEMGVKYMQKWEERVYDRLDGKAEGKALVLVGQIQKKLKRGKPLSQIAEELEENVETIRAYYEAVAASPDKTAEDIVEGFLGDLS